jgi:hypothetical protein
MNFMKEPGAQLSRRSGLLIPIFEKPPNVLFLPFKRRPA